MHVDLESVAVCDLRCGSSEEDPQGFCQIWTHEHIRTQGFDEHTYQRGYMDPVLYGRLIQQCADIGVSSIKLNYRGEPSLHPRIVSFVREAAGLGFPDIMMNTNGNGGARKNPQLFAQMVEAGITDLMFSVDACDPETYHRQRVGGNWEILLNSVRSAVQRARRGQGRPRLPHPRLGGAHAPERRARGQRAHGGVLEGQDGGRLDVDLRVLLPRRHQHHWKAARVAADDAPRVPVLGPVPPHGRDLGRPAHDAVLPGLHARDRRRRRDGRARRAVVTQPARGLGERQLRPAARRAPRSAPGTDRGLAGEPICRSCAVTKQPTRIAPVRNEAAGELVLPVR